MSQFERITFLDRRLREGRLVHTAEIARRFEVSPRQVLRDIEYLRDRLDAPIVWDASARTYRYTKAFESLRFADEKLLIFYALARSIAMNEHYVPVVSSELLAELESHIARDYRTVSDRIRYELTISEKTSMDDFTLVCQAMLLGTRLELKYTDAKGNRSERIVEPERLLNYSGRWYMVAFDLYRCALRTFHLSRFVGLSLSRDRITTPRPAQACRDAIESYVDSGFGIFKGSTTVEAAIRVHGSAAAIVARQEWHPDQRIERGNDTEGKPYVDLSFPVADITELLGRILSFGSAAEPLAPKELLDRWREEIRKMTAIAGIDTTQATATTGVEER